MLTKEEIEKIAKQKYPEKWESHYPTHMADNGWTDENAEKDMHSQKELCLDCLLEDGIIELCSCMIYLNHVPYDYDDKYWKTYNGSDWVMCDAPDIFN